MNHYGRQVVALARLHKQTEASQQFAKYRAKVIDGQSRRVDAIKQKYGMKSSK